MGKATITEHATGVGQVLFMMAAKPFQNEGQAKPQYSIKLQLDVNDQAISHLLTVNDAKVNTVANATLKAEGIQRINFSSDYQPDVIGVEGIKLEQEDIPFFNTTKGDTATAAVTYKVIDYGQGKKPLVRLSGIKLVSLNMAAREESGSSTEDLLASLKNIS